MMMLFLIRQHIRSKKIEEFIDKNELDETVENITNTEKQTISDEEIENLFK